MFEAVGTAYEFDEVEGATLLGVRRHGLTRSSWMIKRVFVLAGSIFILALLAPLFAVIAVAIKLDSPGPVFFRQRRVGREDRVFEIYKFRTMFDGADDQRAALAHRNEAGGGLFKIEDDPRVTRVGRVPRKPSLDELPQLFNILRGDMALVGPRPLVVDEDCKPPRPWRVAPTRPPRSSFGSRAQATTGAAPRSVRLDCNLRRPRWWSP